MVMIIIPTQEARMAHQPLRMTGSRQAILNELRVNGSHPTADEIHEHLRETLPTISLGTVYRNLEYLAKHGLVRIVRELGGRRRYDAARDDHHHMWCTSCGRIKDVRLAPETSVEALIEDDFGYCIDGCNLALLGTCPECVERRDPRSEQRRRDGTQRHQDGEEPADRIRR
jgi:Fe2+ or Zn2+ uptake regulation protein